MKTLLRLVMALAVMMGVTAGSAMAGDKDPLFINLTVDDAHRVDMAVTFGKKQLERGHPLTIFLNDRGVLVASTANGTVFADQRKALGAVIGQGATVIVCPMCMKHYGVKETDLMPGLKIGSPDLTGPALFQDDTKTLTW
ncbi:MAG: DsrE family protein [Chromatiaceae bacterium]